MMKKIIYLYLVTFLIPFLGQSQINKKDTPVQAAYVPPAGSLYVDKDCDGIGSNTVYDPILHDAFCSSTTKGDCDDNNGAVTSTAVWYKDFDGDTFGNPNIGSCTYIAGYVTNSLDCNDNVASVYPKTWYADVDGDGFGTISTTTLSCLCPPGYVGNNTDCNDADIRINPNTKWYFDPTGDGVFSDTEFLDQPTPIIQCTSPGPNYTTAYASTSSQNFNWTHAVSYDVMGNVTGVSRTFFDDLGKPNLSLSRDLVSGKIWGTETTYDAFGREEKSSFAAPSSLPSFGKIGFLTTSATYASTTNLANYYSDNNAEEPYQATAMQPYSQSNYDKLNPKNVINVVGGNQVTIGGVATWKTGYSFTVPAAQEMYYAFGKDYYNGPIVTLGEEVITKFYKNISIDAQGVETVTFIDGEGKTLASARSGSGTAYPVVSLIGTQGYIDVHIPSGTTGAALIGPSTDYKIYNLRTGDPYTYAGSFLAGEVYRIEVVAVPITDPKTYITSSGGIAYTQGALGVTYSVNYFDYSLNYYNTIGQLVKSIQPKGYQHNTTVVAVPNHALISTYQYDTLGQLNYTFSPDEYFAEYAYRKDGQIRFSYNEIHEEATTLPYTNYDDYGRPVESGICDGDWSTAKAATDAALNSAWNRWEQTITVYDYADNYYSGCPPPPATLQAALTAAGLIPGNYIQNNLSGNVAVTYTLNPSNSTTWYSYDIYGRMQWMVQNITGLGVKTVHYSYDLHGNVKKVIYQQDSTTELFAHQYSYNGNDALEKVQTSTDNINFTEHAAHTYYQTGELKRVVLAEGLQGTDYVYTLGGMLKSINHPSLDPVNDPGHDSNDVFGLTIDYYSGDYIRSGTAIETSASVSGVNTDNYDGNIKAIRWADRQKDVPSPLVAVSGSNKAQQRGYMYSYNNNKWLTGATFGNVTSLPTAITPSGLFKEGNITYDRNGNITALERADEMGTIYDSFTYNYQAGNNRLAHIDDNVVNNTGVQYDLKDQNANNYQYDPIGRLSYNFKENLVYSYNEAGLVTEVRKYTPNDLIVRFIYNERGQRIRKESFGPGNQLSSTDYYVLDATGNTLAIYNKLPTGTIALNELPIYGVSRLGMFNKIDGSTVYELTDHLGNVRAVIKKADAWANPMDITKSYADYYPFGEQLPSRSPFNNYRYAFQGQELDGDTGMEAFQLRLWDGRIGRWLSPDPMGQYASPYLGMGNNPINGFDPNGGFWEELGNWLSGNGWKTSSQLYTNIPSRNTNNSSSMFLSEGGITASNPHHINNGVNSHIIGSLGYSADYGALGSTTDGGLALPQDFGSWNSAGSDGRQWIGCMACHGSNGAYSTLASNSPSKIWGEYFGSLATAGLMRMGGAAKGGSFAEKAFLSEGFGITSSRFANSITGVKGTWNNQGGLFKMGWSTQSKYGGGMQLRIGIGSKAGNPNQAWKHIYVPKTFVPNSFANPSIQIKQSLFKLGL